MALLEARELYRFYHSGDEEVRALRGVDVHVETGEFVAVMGPSGSGKSTLLLCLAGLDEPDGGDVIVLGERMTRRSEPTKSELRSRAIGIMLQTNNLFDHLSVEQNVGFAQSIHGTQDRSWSNDVLARLGITARQTARPAELSGGERARASLAVALARKPKILVLDEPTGEVDADAEAVIVGMLKQHCTDGGAAIVATHNRALAKSATRLIPIMDGRISHG
jgi:putative ABC transport system ATP-binding protein